MKKLNSSGSSTAYVITIVSLSLLSVILLVFGIWSFMQRSEYKNQSDKKSAAAVELAKAAQKEDLESEFAEKEKSPYKTYTGPLSFGAPSVKFPKTWSGYVLDKATGTVIDGYFYPSIVPDINSDTAFAFRVKVVDGFYSDQLKQLQKHVDSGKLKAQPFTPKNVPSVSGLMLTGEIPDSKQKRQGIMIVLPLRDKTLTMWTESADFSNDFVNVILPSLTFNP